jgi:hypothetical protein
VTGARQTFDCSRTPHPHTDSWHEGGRGTVPCSRRTAAQDRARSGTVTARDRRNTWRS